MTFIGENTINTENSKLDTIKIKNLLCKRN